MYGISTFLFYLFLTYRKTEEVMSRKKAKQHYCGVGGQAVLDGIMMRNGNDYAIAVRKTDGTIAV